MIVNLNQPVKYSDAVVHGDIFATKSRKMGACIKLVLQIIKTKMEKKHEREDHQRK